MAVFGPAIPGRPESFRIVQILALVWCFYETRKIKATRFDDHNRPLPPKILYIDTIQYNTHYHAPGGIDMTRSASRTAPIKLRALNAQRNLIERAATLSGKNRSDFILETACREAENVLLDQRLFGLNKANFDAFMSALDAPVKDNPALRNLMVRKTPWE